MPTCATSTNDAADELDLKPGTLHNYAKRGCPHERRDGRLWWDVPAIQAWMDSQGLAGKPGHQPSAQSRTLDEAKLRKELALAEKYELQTAKERGKLIDADGEAKRDARVMAALRNRMCGLPAAIAPSLVGLSAAEIQTELDAAVRAILEALAGGSEPAADQA